MSSDLPIDLAALAEHLREQGYDIHPLNFDPFEPGFAVHSSTVRIWIFRTPIADVWDFRISFRYARDTEWAYIDPAEPNAIEQVEEIIKCHLTSP